MDNRKSNEQRTKRMPIFKKDEINRFWSNVAITAREDICWNWTGYNKRGYGCFPVRVRFDITEKAFLPFIATRVSYFLNKNIDPVGFIVMHTCDNPKCVNPNHLFLGTSKQNTADMFNKNRANPPRGINHHRCKLDDDKVRDIKRMLSDGYNQSEIARKYGIYPSIISRIKSGHAWAHVK